MNELVSYLLLLLFLCIEYHRLTRAPICLSHTAQRNDEDHDAELEEDFADAADTDRSILVNGVELVEHVFQAQGARFVPAWRQLEPIIQQGLSTDVNNPDISILRHLAICLLDDVIEHGEADGLR
jgi:hypothetical protein